MSAPSDAYVEVAPAPSLAPYVECLWVHRIDEPPPPAGRRLLPDGRITFVWVAGMGVRIAGPAQRSMSPAPLDRALAFGVRFRPGAAPHLLRTPASEMVDMHVPLDAIDPRLAARIDGRLGAAAVARLDRSGATVAEAAAHGNVSERELQRRFVQDVGYAPKTLQRVLRFQRFMAQLGRPRVELAGAAAAAGYADQSHLSREARRLSGLSPRQLLGHRH